MAPKSFAPVLLNKLLVRGVDVNQLSQSGHFNRDTRLLKNLDGLFEGLGVIGIGLFVELACFNNWEITNLDGTR